MPISTPRAFIALVFVVFGIGLATTMCSFGDDAPEPPGTTALPAPTSTSTRTSLPPTVDTPRPTSTRVPTATPRPTATPLPYAGTVASMRIPRFEVDALVENIGIDATNRLETPRDPLNVGWYGIYQKPGWGYNSVFSAHVDYYPSIRGPFFNLAEAEIDDEIVVVMDNGIEYRYRVISYERYRVEDIPTGDLIRARERPADEEWITLITCGGEFRFNSGSSGPGYYLHRDVVVARRFQ